MPKTRSKTSKDKKDIQSMELALSEDELEVDLPNMLEELFVAAMTAKDGSVFLYQPFERSP